jgi:hypothetical protein
MNPIIKITDSITLKRAIIVCRTIENALNELREKNQIPRAGHVALAGSTLHSGFSYKDLDVLIYPRESAGVNRHFTLDEMNFINEKVLRDKLGFIPVEHFSHRFKEKINRDIFGFETLDGIRMDIFYVST